MKFSSLSEWLDYETKAFLEECILCGECREACPVLPHLGLSSKSYSELQEDLLDVLRGNEASYEACKMISCCAHCYSCIPFCPIDLNYFLVQGVLFDKILAKGQISKKSWAETIEVDHTKYDFYDVLCFMQLKPSEVRWLRQAPQNPKQTDVVLFLGCAGRQSPDKINIALDLLDKLGIDYVGLSGGELCCGYVPLHSGNAKKADAWISELMRALESFRPKTVLFECSTCYYFFKDEYSKIVEYPFEVMHLSQFLCNNLSNFNFEASLNKIITIHDPCKLSRMAGDVTSVRKLISAIPGVNIVEMPHNRQDALCCGGPVYLYSPEVGKAMTGMRMEEAESTGADILVDMCLSCHRNLFRQEKDFSFESINYLTLFGEALGIHYEDKLKKYLQSQSLDSAMEQAREYIEASPFTFEQVRKMISGLFPKP